MKQILAIISFLSILTIAHFACKFDGPLIVLDGKQSYIPSDSAVSYFLADATDFAVEYIFQSRSPDSSKVLVPDSLLNRYLLPLASLYDSRKRLPLLDTLLLLDHIHKQRGRCTSAVVDADTSSDWVQAIKNGVAPIGIRTLDSLVEVCHLTLRNQPDYWGYQGHAQIYLTYPPLNSYALTHVFLSFPGAVRARPSGWINYFSKIDIIPDYNETLVYLYQGFGDCFAGCFGYHRWAFSVNSKYEVTYIGFEVK